MKDCCEQFQIITPDDSVLLVTLTHFTDPSAEMVHPVFRKRRKGTVCEIRDRLFTVCYGRAFLNPRDEHGFDFKIGRRQAVIAALKKCPLLRDGKQMIWDACFAHFGKGI